MAPTSKVKLREAVRLRVSGGVLTFLFHPNVELVSVPQTSSRSSKVPNWGDRFQAPMFATVQLGDGL